MVSPDLLIVGRLRKPHGVRGEIVVEPITDAPAEVFVAGRRFLTGTTDGNLTEDGGTLVATAVRPFREGLVLVLFEGVTGRADAEALRNRYLLAPRSELSPPGEHEVYYHELVGMRVELTSGEVVGDVTALYEVGQGLVMDVSRDSKTVVLPFHPDFILELDSVSGRLVMQLPEGLLE